MTGEQLDELMTIAVNMQRDSEIDGDRPTAMFAHAVQVAVLELHKVRNDAAALAAENAGLKKYICDECYIENIKTGATKCAGLGMPETPATEAYLVRVRVQGMDVVAWSSPNEERTCDIRRQHNVVPGPLYTVPPSLAMSASSKE
jgi:hypothetical protein